MVLPEALLPKAEALHVAIGVAKGGVAVGSSLQVHGPQFLQVAADDLISVTENYFLQVEWEENVQEEDFIGPDDALFFCLLVQPCWPFVRHKPVYIYLGKERK